MLYRITSCHPIWGTGRVTVAADSVLDVLKKLTRAVPPRWFAGLTSLTIEKIDVD